jgi:hypothetical protein
MKYFRILAVVLAITVTSRVIADVDPVSPPPTEPMKGIDLSKSAEIDWPKYTHIFPVTDGTFKGFALNVRRYTKHHASPSYGMTDFTVTKSGMVYIRCKFFRNNYLGGQWKKEVWELDDFSERGWEQIGTVGKLKSGEPLWRYFSKYCKAEENYKIRVWKYQPVDIFTPAKVDRFTTAKDAPVPVDPTYTWTGEVPFQKWNKFHSTVLAPLQSAESSKITVTIEFDPKAGQEQWTVEPVNDALKELGLDGTVQER